MNELNLTLTQSGLSITAQRYLGGVATGSAIALTEVGTSGFYTGHMAGAAGDYQIVFKSGTANVGAGAIRWSGSAEILPATSDSVPSSSSIATQVRTELSPELGQIGGIKAKTDQLNTTRLSQVSTVETTGAQIAAALS